MTGPTPALRSLLALALLALTASACGGGGSSAPQVVDPARSGLSAAPAQRVADGAATISLTAVARDAAGSPIAGRTAAFAVDGTGNTLSAAQATTGADGTATVTVRSTKAEAKTASVTIDGVAVAQTAALTFVPGAPSPTTSTIEVLGAPATADGVAAASARVTVRDATGNPVAGATVDFTATGATATPSQVTSDAAGVATTQVTSTAAGTATIAAAVGGVALAGPADVAFLAGPAASLVLAAQPAAGIAGTALAALTVSALDAHGNAATLPGPATVTLLRAPAGAALAGTSTQPAGAAATFADLVVERSGGYALRVASGGLQVDGADFVVAPAAPSAGTSSVAAASPTATAGAQVGLTATVRDAYGNPVPGVAVTFSATGTANTLTQPAAATDGAGQAAGAISSTLAEAKTVSASTGGSAGVTFLAGPPAAATSSLSASGSPATADGLAAVAVTASLRDAFDNPVAGVVVDFTAAGATLSPAQAATGADGRASVAATSTVAGAASVSAGAGPLSLGPQAISFVAGPAASLVLTAQPSGGVAGAPLAPVTVAARDAHGNATTLPGAATVTLLTAPDGAVLSGTASAPAGATATFADLSVQRRGSYRLRVASGGLQVDGAAFAVAPAAATALAFTASPAGVAAGTPFGATVELRDAFGNVADDAASVTLAIGAPGTLSGVTVAAAVAGVATFAGLTTDRAGATTLGATSPGLASASAPLTVAPGPAAALAFAVQPAGGAAGDLLSPPVEVALRDAFGNAVTDDGVAVSVALLGGPGGATLLGTTTHPTVGGRATFADLAVDRAGAGYALGATATGLTPATSAAFGITAAAVDPATSTVVAGAATATAGGAVTLTATARDFFGNPVAGAAVTLAASGTDNTVTQPGALTDAAGQASGSLSSTLAEAKTVSASAGGAPFATTASVTFLPDVPATSTSSLVASPSTATADGLASVGLTANVLDQYGNPVPGVTVAFSASGSGNAFTPASATTGAAGRANAILRSTVAELKSVSASSGATALGAPLQITFTPGPAAALALTAQPVAGVAGVTLATLRVEARDDFGNATALPGAATVSLLAAPPGAALGGTTTVAGAGAATFGDLVLVQAGSYRLRVSSGALSVDGAAFTVAPAAAAALAFTASPAGPVAAGAGFGATVEVRDAFGNLTGSSATVSLALGGPGTLAGTTSRAAVDGVATFTGLTVDLAGDHLLVATSAPLAGASAPLTVTAGPAAALAFAVQPADVAAGDLFAPPVEVALHDAFGNEVADDGVAVAVELVGGPDGATLFGAPLALSVGGRAAFADLAIDLAGGYQLRATASGLADALSAAFQVTSGFADPGSSDVAVSPTVATAGETVALTATVRDFFGNPVPGQSVTLSATGSANVVVQPSASTDEFGRASGELTSTRAEEKTVSGSLGGAAFSGTSIVTYLPDVPSAATSTLAASPASVLADGTAIALTATILDQYANPIPGLDVTFAADGPVTFVQPGGGTDAGGVATGSASSLTPGARHLSAMVGGLALAGVDVTFESTDRDGDGIPNGEDAFPDDPTRFDAFVAVPLERLVGGAFGVAVAINDADQVAGYGDDGAGSTRAVAWAVAGLDASPAVELQPLPGNASSAAYGIGPTGTVVGESEKGADTVAVLWLAGSAVPAELSLAGVAPPAAALGIGGGFIVGEARAGGQRRGVLWTTAGADPVPLATLGGASSAAYAVSATGLVVGEALTGGGLTRGAVWTIGAGGTPGPAVALPPLAGHVRSAALAVSDAGVVVGESEAADGTIHGVRWVLSAAGVPGPAGDLGPGGVAAVNATRVAGASGAPDRAVTWDLRNLALAEDLLAGATEPSRALGMNAANKVVGLAGAQGFLALPP